MEQKKYVTQLQELVGITNVWVDEPMQRHTSFKVGGTADYLVTPCSASDLCSVMELCKREKIPIFIMGNGTNLLVSDKGIRGVVIKLCDNMNGCFVQDDCIEAHGGILLSKLSKVALDHQLTGLEFAAGIPGTLGGAVAMNAGAYGGEMKDIVIETEYIDGNGGIKRLVEDEHQFGYRTSFIQKQACIAIKTVMRLKKGDKTVIKALMDDLATRRRNKQPLDKPSAGSTFKRPEGYFAGSLIEDCGLRGYCIGGAQVSDKHCGFIVNNGNATASDVMALIRHVQNTVKDKFDVVLQTEVRIVGEWD